MNGYNGKFEMVNPRTILIDLRYQREKKNSLIQQIASHPAWEAFGAPVCFRRNNGMLYCADGQQRIAGVLASEKPPKEVPVIVFEIQDVAEEAEMFARINEWRKSLQALEKHRAKIVAGDPPTLAIERAVAMAGFTVDNVQGSRGADAKTIQAVARLGAIYNRIGEEGLLQTLTVIRDAWPDDGAALGTHILHGVAQLIEEQGDNYNRVKLTNALKKTQPYLVTRKADELKYKFGGSKMSNVRLAFQELSGLKMPNYTKTGSTAKLTAK